MANLDKETKAWIVLIVVVSFVGALWAWKHYQPEQFTALSNKYDTTSLKSINQ